MANEANWPVVGSEHEWIPGDRDLKARVLELDRNQGLIRIEQVDKSDNRLMGDGYWISLKNFSTGYQPSDQSPIPALTKALRGYQAAAESWHECHHNKTVVGCDAICDLIPEGRAALALVEASGG